MVDKRRTMFSLWSLPTRCNDNLFDTFSFSIHRWKNGINPSRVAIFICICLSCGTAHRQWITSKVNQLLSDAKQKKGKKEEENGRRLWVRMAENDEQLKLGLSTYSNGQTSRSQSIN